MAGPMEKLTVNIGDKQDDIYRNEILSDDKFASIFLLFERVIV